jgi:hypothetical protein
MAVSASALVGVGVLSWLIYSLGWRLILEQARALGGILPVVLVLTGLKYPLQAAGWRVALAPSDRPPWGAAISATIAGDALGYLTWAGALTGEPIKAALSRDRVPVAVGVAAGAVERGLYNLTAAGVVLVAWLLLASPEARLSTLLGLALAGAIVAWRARRRRRTPTETAPPTATDTRTPPHDGALRSMARLTKRLWRERRSALGVIVALGFAQHALLVAEAFGMLDALGARPTLETAIVFEGVTKIVNSIGTVVPGRIGVSEGGSALFGAALGYQAAHGFGLALMRRVRALLWALVGLALLWGREATIRRSRPR